MLFVRVEQGCSVIHFLLLDDSLVSSGDGTYDGSSSITLEYTIALSEDTAYKCKATLVADDTVTDTTVNIFKTG